MNRDGFLLGVIATGSQVLILRELISSLQGNELFIGAALCGWLVWGAFGAWLGNRARTLLSARLLFLFAALLLPASIVDTRLAPMVVTSSVGEPVSFVHALLMSLLIVAPSALVCGWLFPTIARRLKAEAPVPQVYFSEGVGAFAACAAITLLTYGGFSTLTIAVALAAIVLLAALWTGPLSPRWRFGWTSILLLSVVGSPLFAPWLDHRIERAKFSPYTVLSTWDTPYSHQTLIDRDHTRVLLTDNRVEAVEHDLQSAENLLLPPLAYRPDIRSVIVIGQLDLMFRPVMASLPGVTFTDVDPRRELDEPHDTPPAPLSNFQYFQEDPITYLRALPDRSCDLVMITLSESGSYCSLRLIFPGTLEQIRRVLRPGGLVQIAAPYDTERYLTSITIRILATVKATLDLTFPRTIVWPGPTTLFLAGDSTLAVPDLDSLSANLARLPYRSQFLTEGYLADRLNSWTVERLDSALAFSVAPQTIERPTLALLQLAGRSQIHAGDRWLARLATHPVFWLIPVALVLIMIGLLGATGYRRRSPHLLFFAAGCISLTLELLSFYVYQCSVGLLYSQLSLLIGCFMLGLAVGARLAMSIRTPRLPIITLGLLALITLIFLFTATTVPAGLALTYHALFQFAAAFATGALFVAATRLTIAPDSRTYALELAGSAFASLFVLPVLLPALGLSTISLATAVLLVSLLALTCHARLG